jgi:hypothetical protein
LANKTEDSTKRYLLLGLGFAAIAAVGSFVFMTTKAKGSEEAKTAPAAKLNPTTVTGQPKAKGEEEGKRAPGASLTEVDGPE